MLKAITTRMKRSLKWKFVILIVTILVFTVSAIGFFSYNQTMRSVGKDIDRLSNQILTQANLNLDRYYTEYETIFLLLGSSLEFREWLQSSDGDKITSTTVRYYERIKENYLNRVFLQYPEVLSVTIYNPDGMEQHFTNGTTLSAQYSLRNEPFLLDSGKYEKVKFIPRLSDYYTDKSNLKVEKPVLTLFKQFYNGYVTMDISLTPSQNIMSQIDIASGSEAAVIDSAGMIIHHSDSGEVMNTMDERIIKQVAERPKGTVYDKRSKDLIVYQTIERTDWKILAIIPYKKIAGSIYYVRGVTIVISLSALIISIILTYWASSSVVRRIAKLRHAMVITQVKNNFNIRADVDGNDEVTDLSLSFNNLLGHLEQSIHDLAETRVQQHQAVISALQSQINSHFLYNTLETINSMALIAGNPNVGHVAVALSRMLRYTSDYKDRVVTLKDEMKHAEDYLAIMKVRFGDEVTFAFDIPEDLHGAGCPKAVLQPLVENCIKHTRETTAESVTIRIEADVVRWNRLRLKVSDDGQGFAEQTLSRLNAEVAAGRRFTYDYKGVGLSNLIYRLHMLYAEEADIRFGNRAGGGAFVEIGLPLRIANDGMEIEGERDEQNFDRR
ncbi:sensor histidine kinase [Paenibacillus sp. MMO-58]|uniref:sensor histidine kinase n=1 Tax=Paenibacillus sp. MMO-58 TaxID=3081290 RepID=UPI00301A73F1